MLFHAALLSVVIAVVALSVAHPSAPEEPWPRRLARVVPLSVIAGSVLAWAAAGA